MLRCKNMNKHYYNLDKSKKYIFIQYPNQRFFINVLFFCSFIERDPEP